MAWCSDCTRADALSTSEVFGDGTPVASKNLPIASLPVDRKEPRTNSKQPPTILDDLWHVPPSHDLLRLEDEDLGDVMSAQELMAIVRTATLRPSPSQIRPTRRQRRCSFFGLCLEAEKAERWNAALWSGLLLFLSALVLLTVAFVVVIVVVGNQVGDELTKEAREDWVGTPDNLVDAMRSQCVELQRQALPFMDLIEGYNRQRGFRKVSFVTRRETQAQAWCLPSQGPARVVIVHGRKLNGLSSSAQAAGYFLRLMNVSALIVSDLTAARDNLSDWLADDLTVLGAWDYAVSDPDGFLGGPVDPQQVAVMGFDFGGFSAQRAFGLEPRIPALLLDGVVHDFQALLAAEVRAIGWDFLQGLLQMQVTSRCELNLQRAISQVGDLATGWAARGGNTSYIGMIRSNEDRVIHSGAEQSEALLRSLQSSLGSDKLLLNWATAFSGPSSRVCWEHRALHLSKTREYQQQLCGFFSTALGLSVDCVAAGAPLALL
ncbi:unnamed protein product [Effrenium voratum]|uniref:Uncharacterized protein n=1 Tax=Effrenium voratum TaxID=2562239 RepID=A0AA36JKJ8_9DINO|nr:unnamed protein product [Effrenium voratum]